MKVFYVFDSQTDALVRVRASTDNEALNKYLNKVIPNFDPKHEVMFDGFVLEAEELENLNFKRDY